MKALRMVFRVVMDLAAAAFIWVVLVVVWGIVGNDGQMAMGLIVAIAVKTAIDGWGETGWMSGLIFGRDGEDDEDEEDRKVGERLPAVVDPSGIGRRVDASDLVWAIKIGMCLHGGKECRVNGLWVFRDDPVDFGEDPARAGVIRISTEPPAEPEWEEVEE